MGAGIKMQVYSLNQVEYLNEVSIVFLHTAKENSPIFRGSRDHAGTFPK